MMLALFMAMQAAVTPPVPAAAVGVVEPPSWWQVAARDATLRLVAAEPPAAPRRYRFQCIGERLIEDQARRYTPQRCIDADAGIVADEKSFATRAAAEATRPATAPEERQYRAAWLRAMTFHAAPLDRGRTARSFLVEEVVAPGDLQPPPAPTEPAGEQVFAVPPAVDYPSALLREDVGGLVRLACRAVSGAPECRAVAIEPATEIIRTDGSLEPRLRGRLLLLHAAHRAMQPARFAETTRSGRPSAGLTFPIGINFAIARD